MSEPEEKQPVHIEQSEAVGGVELATSSEGLEATATVEEVDRVLGAASAVVDRVKHGQIILAGDDSELQAILAPIAVEADQALDELRVALEGSKDVQREKIIAVIDAYKSGEIARDIAIAVLVEFSLEEVMKQNPTLTFDVGIVFQLYEKKIEKGEMQEVLSRPLEELFLCDQIVNAVVRGARRSPDDRVLQERSKSLLNDVGFWGDWFHKTLAQRSTEEVSIFFTQLGDFQYGYNSDLCERVDEFFLQHDCRLGGSSEQISFWRHSLLNSRSIADTQLFVGVTEEERAKTLFRRSVDEVVLAYSQDILSHNEVSQYFENVYNSLVSWYGGSETADQLLVHWGSIETFFTPTQHIRIYAKSSQTPRQIIDRFVGTANESFISAIFEEKRGVDNTSDLSVSEILQFFTEVKQYQALVKCPTKRLIGSGELGVGVLVDILAAKWLMRSGGGGVAHDTGTFHTLPLNILLQTYEQLATKSQYGRSDLSDFERDVLASKTVDELESDIPGGATNNIFWRAIVWKPIDVIRKEWPGVRPGIPMKGVFLRKCIVKKMEQLDFYPLGEGSNEALASDLADNTTIAELQNVQKNNRHISTKFERILIKKSIEDVVQAYRDGVLKKNMVRVAAGGSVERWVELMRQDSLDETDLRKEFLYDHVWRDHQVERLDFLGAMEVCEQRNIPRAFVVDLAKMNSIPFAEIDPALFSEEEYLDICGARPLEQYVTIKKPISNAVQEVYAQRIIENPSDKLLEFFYDIEKDGAKSESKDVRSALFGWCQATSCLIERASMSKFCDIYRRDGREAAHEYIATLKQRASSLIDNPAELRKDAEYPFYVRHVFPSGNYSTHEKNLACGDRLEHLEPYTFDPNGYPVEMSGLLGYRLKEKNEGQEGGLYQADDILFDGFQRRVQAIRDVIVQRGPDNKALQKDFDVRVAGMCAEYVDPAFQPMIEKFSPKEKLFALFVSEAIRRQQKKDKYKPNKDILDLAIMYKYAYHEDLEAYVRRTADEAQSFKDPDSQRYVMLQELSTIYGENMKHVLRHNVWEELVAQKDGHFAEIVEQYNESVGGQTEERSLKPKQVERIQQGIENPNIPLDDQEVVDSKTGQTKIKSGKFSVLSKQVRDMFGTNIKFRANEEREAFDSELTEILAPLRTDVSIMAFEQLVPRLFALRERYRFNLASQLEDVFTADLHRINTEIAKYEEVVEEEKKETRMNGPKDKKIEKSSKKRKIRGFITKTKETTNARMGAYLCIAGDIKMWENKNYFELVMKDEDTGKCVGLTMMLKIDAQDGKKYLWFGPNPFESFLTQVRADACLEYMYNTARQFAEENGFDGIVIPSNESAVLGSCTNRGGTFPDLINAKRLRDSKGQSRVVPFGGQHDLGGSYGFTDGGLIWERGVKQKKATPIIA